MEISDLRIGMYINEKDLFNIKDIVVCLKDVKYNYDKKYGYSLVEGEIVEINSVPNICNIRLNNTLGIDKENYCIYRNEKEFKSLHEKKTENAIEMITWLLSFLRESWSLELDKLVELAKECELFEYIVKNRDYLNSLDYYDIERLLYKEVVDKGKSVHSCTYDEYYIPIKFENITSDIVRRLCEQADINVYEAFYKIMVTNSFKEYAEKYIEVYEGMFGDYNKEENDTIWKNICKELGLKDKP